MTTFETDITIDARPDRVWDVVADIPRWPEWTRSIKTVRRLDDGPIGVGSRVRIKQPDLLPTVWRITEWIPGRRFVWVTGHVGLVATAEHDIEAVGDGSRLMLRLTFEGLLSRPVGYLGRSLTEHYMHLEATGCKARSEGLL